MGDFLDSLPSALYIGAHVLFLLIGLWAMKRAKDNKQPFASAFWLYVLAQAVFIAMFGGVFTMKMAVLLDQTLMVIMVIMIAKAKRAA
jgi:low temperature requirement protein LtrA